MEYEPPGIVGDPEPTGVDVGRPTVHDDGVDRDRRVEVAVRQLLPDGSGDRSPTPVEVTEARLCTPP
jgi:hypothetical protein